MQELKNLKLGDFVAVIRADLILRKGNSYSKGKVVKVSKREITVGLQNGKQYKYSIKSGNIIGHQTFDQTHCIEVWDQEKHDFLWRKYNLTVKAFRFKGELIEKLNSLDIEADDLDSQWDIIEKLGRIKNAIEIQGGE